MLIWNLIWFIAVLFLIGISGEGEILNKLESKFCWVGSLSCEDFACVSLTSEESNWKAVTWPGLKHVLRYTLIRHSPNLFIQPAHWFISLETQGDYFIWWKYKVEKPICIPCWYRLQKNGWLKFLKSIKTLKTPRDNIRNGIWLRCHLHNVCAFINHFIYYSLPQAL